MAEVIGVRFKEVGKVYYFDPDNKKLRIGDTVIVERTSYARNGDIVIALVGDEATCKVFYKEDGHYRLQPMNSAMQPIIVNEVVLLGKVISCFRNYN